MIRHFFSSINGPQRERYLGGLNPLIYIIMSVLLIFNVAPYIQLKKLFVLIQYLNEALK